MSRLPLPTVPVLPGAYANLLVDVVARWGISPEQLLEGSGLPLARLQETFWYVEFDAFDRLLARAVALTGEPGLGLHLGLQMTVTCHGVVGFAAMVAGTLREALKLMQQFLAQRCDGLRLCLTEADGLACLAFEQPLPGHRLGDVALAFLLMGTGRMGNALTGQCLDGIAELSFARPAYLDRFADQLPAVLRFGQPHDRLLFPSSHLDLPLVMADPRAARLAQEQCQRVLNSLVAGRQSLAGRVRELVYDEARGFRRMDEVAERLHMSERTLQRQLAGEQQTFKGIVEALREEKATQLLRHQELSIAVVAERLGYTELANFTRAFKRWRGCTPSQYRTALMM
ncbi:MAG: AraC family transcriptional regulator [Pseudomonadota bacterium]